MIVFELVLMDGNYIRREFVVELSDKLDQVQFVSRFIGGSERFFARLVFVEYDVRELDRLDPGDGVWGSVVMDENEILRVDRPVCPPIVTERDIDP